MKKDTVSGSQDNSKAIGEHVGKKPLTLVTTVSFTPRRVFHAADIVAVLHVSLALWVTEFCTRDGSSPSNTQTQRTDTRDIE